MGVRVSTLDRAGLEKSVSIDRQIEEDSRRLRKECKVLVLASGETSSSTIVKQMKISSNGYTTDERLAFVHTVFKNLLDSAHTICNAMQVCNLQAVDAKSEGNAERILGYQLERDGGKDGSVGMTPEVASMIYDLYHDPIMAQVLERQNEFDLMDSAGYFLNDAKRIAGPGYVPTDNDILHARLKTTAIQETRFNMGQLNIIMLDVSGQRSERRKWIHCFEIVVSVVFCATLSDYDQTLLEDCSQNRLLRSLVLFESVINSRWFRGKSIILMLNNIDAFKAKLSRVPLEHYFPEYTGGADVNKAVKYILWRFMLMNRAKLSVYPHLIQATDPGNLRLVFAAVKETILQKARNDSDVL